MIEDSIPSNQANHRVLHLINGEHYSGAERVQDILAQSLPRFGYEVELACVKPSLFPKMRKSNRARLHLTPMKSKLDFALLRQLCDLVRDRNIELLHAHTPRTLLIGALVKRRTGVPLVYHVHSPVLEDTHKRVGNWVNAAVEWICARGVARIITVSESLQKRMISIGHDAKRLHVVHNGVGQPRLERSPEQPEQKWTLGMIALFRPRKGAEILLEAIAKLVAEGRDLHLRMIGPFETEDYKSEIETLVDSLGLSDRIEFRGFRSDIDEELSMLDLLAVPSLFGEGLPMVVLEAMASGVPVIGTDVEGIPEAVQHGINGLVANAGSSESMASEIRSFLSGRVDWQLLRTNAMTSYSERFTNLAMTSGVVAVYDQVFEDNKHQRSRSTAYRANDSPIFRF